MRSIDLAVYADSVAAEAAALSARIERARGRLRRAALEREARVALEPETVSELERLGLLAAPGGEEDADEVAVLQHALAAVRRLQAWVKERLALAEARATVSCDQEDVVTVS